MPAYVYKAKKESSETVTGRIDAENQDAAIELIHDLGLLPVTVEESKSDGRLIREIKYTKVKNKETYLFSRQMASLIKSGVPLLQALEVISRQTKNKTFADAIDDISLGVRNGRSLSFCLADYPHIFSLLYVSMIKAGEESGNLREMFLRMADYQKSQEEISSKVRSATAYPAFMLIIGIVTVVFILTFVMPKISVMFKDLGQSLPWPTQVVLGVSNVIRTAGVWGFCALLFLGVLINRWVQTQRGRAAVSRVVLIIPFVRTFFLRMDLARFCRTLALLLKSGLPILRAIEVAVPTLDNNFVKRDILLCVQGLTAGDSLGVCLKRSHVIPDMVSQLIAVGEESGSLIEALSDISESYEQEINESTKFMTTLLEPIMILSIGVVVGFIVFAMLLPIFQMDLLAH